MSLLCANKKKAGARRASQTFGVSWSRAISSGTPERRGLCSRRARIAVPGHFHDVAGMLHCGLTEVGQAVAARVMLFFHQHVQRSVFRKQSDGLSGG